MKGQVGWERVREVCLRMTAARIIVARLVRSEKSLKRTIVGVTALARGWYCRKVDDGCERKI